MNGDTYPPPLPGSVQVRSSLHNISSQSFTSAKQENIDDASQVVTSDNGSDNNCGPHIRHSTKVSGMDNKDKNLKDNDAYLRFNETLSTP